MDAFPTAYLEQLREAIRALNISRANARSGEELASPHDGECWVCFAPCTIQEIYCNDCFEHDLNGALSASTCTWTVFTTSGVRHATRVESRLGAAQVPTAPLISEPVRAGRGLLNGSVAPFDLA